MDTYGYAHQRKGASGLFYENYFIQAPKPPIGSRTTPEVRVRSYLPQSSPDFDKTGVRTGLVHDA